MTTLKMLATASLIVLAAGQAQAAVITRSYTSVSTFTSGPNLLVTQSYTLTFDPASNAAATLSNYSATPFANPFNKASSVVTRNYTTVGFAQNSITIGPNGINGFGSGDDAYFLNLAFDTQGNIDPTGYNQLRYSFSGATTSYDSTSVVTTVVPTTPSVPEPATWAIMIVGFGLVGGTIRRRQKVATRVAFA